ncbi:MAG: alpha/beta fold hydrolase, partial [Hymenobacteraceae bacterium]|nr:alpha/beta fold hydrolase [Hymenobacteraceae bacterium]
MPVLDTSAHKSPFYLFNGHMQTIVPALFRTVEGVEYVRERIETPDKDFLDLDWSRIGSDKLVVLSHGLEGDAGRPYIKGMVKAMNAAGADALAWNYRSCSGELNKLLRSYHMGVTDDLHYVITHALQSKKYKEVFLIGFSAGGNITLKYLGEAPQNVPSLVKRAVVFSVPVDLKSGAEHLAKLQNRVYLNRFLKTLRAKMAQKAQQLPGQLDITDYEKLTTFEQFDNRFTAPIHGFKDAEDYYARCSSKQFLPHIEIPTLVVNAQNDPFLSKECFPFQEAARNPHVFLEVPEQGGHVGFTEDYFENKFYS